MYWGEVSIRAEINVFGRDRSVPGGSCTGKILLLGINLYGGVLLVVG